MTTLSVPSRAAADIGDFNGDGHQDLVWMGISTLQVTVHYYNNSTYLSWNWLNKTGGTPGWVVVAAADFDGNGIPDLVWQNTSTQQVIIQYYGGTGGATNIGSYTLSSTPEPGWSVVAAADFDGNGVPDLVWQNATTGVVTVWYYGITNGVISNIGWNYLNKAGNPGWTIKAAADFDGNGVPDLVWQNKYNRDSYRQLLWRRWGRHQPRYGDA